MVEFDQFVEYVMEGGEGPVINSVDLASHTLESPLTLVALQAGYGRASAWGREYVIDPAPTQAAVAAVYAQDVADHEAQSSDPAVVVDRLLWVAGHPMWHYGVFCAQNSVWVYLGTLWRCLQDHTVQPDPNYAPGIAVSLWAHYYAPSEIPAWAQPVGASNAWPLGAQATHNGNLWQSLIQDNVWEPGAAGSELLWECLDCAQTSEWAIGVAYTGDNTAGAGNGDAVIYEGAEYRCLQTHTSQAGWSPPVVPALWLAL